MYYFNSNSVTMYQQTIFSHISTLLTKLDNYFKSEKKILLEKAFHKMQQKNYQEALQDLYLLEEKYRCTSYELYHNRGVAYYQLKDYQKALLEYEKARVSNPDSEESYIGKGVIYILQKNYKKALENYSKAIQANPYNTMNYTNQGFIYLQTKEYRLALQSFCQALVIYPCNALAYANRGAAYQALGESYQASKDWEKAKELGLEYPGEITSCLIF